ncbi:MAG: hypothetical protein B6I34_10505 [Anaerolineaceae bacterium 4572_32.1]|nr:MAG: hypothetical protein B6I34_10505 [Anaerolineaceae bacterium 4572_32.1]
MIRAEQKIGSESMNKYSSPSDRNRAYNIFIVSDATGQTAEQVVNAALAQFESDVADVLRFPRVRTEQDVRQIVHRAARERGIIVHTLAVTELREAMLEEGRHYQVDTIDLMGPLLTRLSTRLRVSPRAQPGLFRHLDQEYYSRIEAVDYTVKHDDGQNPQDLPLADIVIVGVSRTCKTPLCIYLAYRGWRVANVPIVMDIDPPRQLAAVEPQRIVALTMHPDQLLMVRRVRLRRLDHRMPGGYANYESILHEVETAQRFYRRNKWPIVEVTNKSIEEIATEVIALARRRQE